MIECLIIGDHMVNALPYNKECTYYVRPNFASIDFYEADIRSTEKAGYVILSVSSNDTKTRALAANLRDIRGRIDSNNVIWFIPVGEGPVRDTTIRVAMDNNDMILDVREYGARSDGIPPQSVDKVNNRIADIMRGFSAERIPKQASSEHSD